MLLTLVTSTISVGFDDDLPFLTDALDRAGHTARTVHWDDPDADWSVGDAVIIRSPWDYSTRFEEFLAWTARVEATNTLLNPAPVLRWNLDKQYLADLAALGVAVVPAVFVEPADHVDLGAAMAEFAESGSEEMVVKPTVSAGSRETARYTVDRLDVAASHVARLHAAGSTVMLQPYLPAVDEVGETSMYFYRGVFSHAIRKGPMLVFGADASDEPNMSEVIDPRQPSVEELELGEATMAAVANCDVVASSGLSSLPYARVDVLRGIDDTPTLLEVECAEPSMFFRTCPEAADTFAAALVDTINERRGIASS